MKVGQSVLILKEGQYFNMKGKIIADETWSGKGRLLIEPEEFNPWNDSDDCPGDEEGEFFNIVELKLLGDQ